MLKKQIEHEDWECQTFCEEDRMKEKRAEETKKNKVDQRKAKLDQLQKQKRNKLKNGNEEMDEFSPEYNMDNQ